MKNIVKNTILVFTGFVLSMTLITVFAEDVKTSVTKILNETGIITTETMITSDEAIAIAKAQASEDTVLVEVKLDIDDKEYEIKLTSDMYKYEIEIHAVSGLVKDLKKELLVDNTPTTQLLSEEEVIAIARTVVGDATLVEFELEDDDLPPYYELEFEGNDRKYELKIDAVTGAILESKVEFDDDDDDEINDDDDDEEINDDDDDEDDDMDDDIDDEDDDEEDGD
ncbi:MAG: PepSY domain-containing protein [Erysipelotrichaceae bacterium]|nr:PepSY domain-containing protein [Erysipelotrichaceae bacterium]